MSKTGAPGHRLLPLRLHLLLDRRLGLLSGDKVLVRSFHDVPSAEIS